MAITPVILSGGFGTGLWPLSREMYPKQLLAFSGGRTLFQDTLFRLDGLVDTQGEKPAAPVIVCNDESRFLVIEQLQEAGRTSSKIILEPEGRNTAPALTLAALSILENGGDSVMLVLPSDHVIRQLPVFHATVRKGWDLARGNKLVAFGIAPTHAETRFGYIRLGPPVGEGTVGETAPLAHMVSAFVEKPDAETARKYFESGYYLWNSGIFMMTASAWLEEINRLRPDIMRACRAAHDGGVSDDGFQRVEAEAFKLCPADSIDYAVMEKAVEKAVVVRLDADWSDVGTWPAIWELLPKDAAGNVVRGDVVTRDTYNSLLFAEHHLLAAVGVKDIIIVETADAVLVADKAHAQDIRSIVEWLKGEKRGEHLTHRRVYRPWGSYDGVDSGERYQVKRITVKPGAALSLQMHRHRAEHWVVVKGTAKVTRGDDVFLVSENQSTYIPLGAVHRLENPGTELLEIIEVQSGSYLGEDDIVRLEDRYNRKT